MRTVIQNIHGPVFGPVAGGDIHGTAPAADAAALARALVAEMLRQRLLQGADLHVCLCRLHALDARPSADLRTEDGKLHTEHRNPT